MDKPGFEEIKNRIVFKERERTGIGTLSEKTVHAVLKNYYEPDVSKHEVPVEKYVADIFTGTEIIEIQTRQFNKMREKLKSFLPLYPVTIVYPIPALKWLIWVDPVSGRPSEPRKSPKKGNVYDAFIELYRLKMFLKDENIRFRFVLMEMEEYKLLNGWSTDRKKGSSRFDRIPVSILEEVDITGIKDYMQFVPESLSETFTSKDFAKAAHINVKLARTVLNILKEVEVVRVIGKAEKNSLVYEVSY
ncbi:MAG: hypothetical protein K6D96_06790 [Acetatifactor sp.]|nr:hypothetical protein [Acetatifactor sp.]